MGKLFVICTMIVLPIAGCAKEERKSTPPASAMPDVVAKTAVLANIANTEQPSAVDSASGDKPMFQVVFSARGDAVAYVTKVADRFRVVYNGKVGRPIESLDVILLSPDGRRIAYSGVPDGKWRMVVDDTVGVPSDAVGAPVFSPDSRHIAYAARSGERWRMVVDGLTSAECKGYSGRPVFSADSRKIAYVEKMDDKGATRLVISDLAFKSQQINDASGAQLLANEAKTSLAAVRNDKGKQRVIQLGFDKPGAINEGPRYDAISNLAFGDDSVSVAYVAERDGNRFLVLNGKEAPLPDGNVSAPPVVRPDGKDAGVIMESGGRFFLYQAFSHDSVKENGNGYEEAVNLAYSRDGRQHAFVARKGNGWFVVVNGKEGEALDRAVTPKFSPDGKYLVYRARKDGKRFVVVADTSGTTIRHHPSYEQVFDVQFTTDGKSLAYGVKDGQKLIWKVEVL
jgi:WD40 repeat protein